jgi:hypothetical protein
MIVRLLSIATHIRSTLLDAYPPALRPAPSNELEHPPENFPTGESARSGSRSVQAQLRPSKAAWFREDEGAAGAMRRLGPYAGPGFKALKRGRLGNAYGRYAERVPPLIPFLL